MRLPCQLLLVLCAALLPSAHASHDSPEKVLGSWAVLSPRMHILKPAATVRDLPASTNPELVRRLTPDGKAFARDNFSALMIEDGAIVFEEYAQGATRESPLNAYSMAKSWTALAVGEALCAGKIKSLEDTAATYVPELTGTAYGAASIRNLLRYTSGAQDPGGNGYVGIHDTRDFGAMVQHQMSLLDLLRKYGGKGRFNAGEKFIYNGLDSDALSLVVRGATGVSLPVWFESTVWKKAGAEYPAGWYLDRDGNAVAEILVFATTRDFARVGLYVLEHLNGKMGDACMQAFMKDAAHPHVAKGYWNPAPSWGLGLHHGADSNTWMFGHGGQRVGINARTGRVFAANGSKDHSFTDPNAQSLLGK
jgi:CubicO group peptidase (beta-lactamase class C family)